MSDDLAAQYQLNRNFDYSTYINEDDEMPVTAQTTASGSMNCAERTMMTSGGMIACTWNKDLAQKYGDDGKDVPRDECCRMVCAGDEYPSYSIRSKKL